MSPVEPSQLAQYLSRKRVLLLTGFLCEEVDLNGRKLVDYAAGIARRLGAPVAAGATTALALRQRGVPAVKKMFAAEVVNYFRYPWQDSVAPARPEVLVLIGYPLEASRSLISAVRDAETVSLGNAYVPEATFSFPDCSFARWQRLLEELLEALGKDRNPSILGGRGEILP